MPSLKRVISNNATTVRVLVVFLGFIFTAAIFRAPFFHRFPVTSYDGVAELEMARNWFEGRGYNLNTLDPGNHGVVIKRPPLFGTLSLLISKALHLPLLQGGVLLSIIAGCLTVSFAFLLAYTLYGWRVGAITGILTCTSPFLIYMAVYPIDYALSAFLTLFVTYLLWWAKKKSHTLPFAIVGIGCALGYLSRQELVFLLPMSLFLTTLPLGPKPIATFSRRITQAGIVLIVFFIIAAPRIITVAKYGTFLVNWKSGIEIATTTGTPRHIWEIGKNLKRGISDLAVNYYFLVFCVLPWFLICFVDRYNIDGLMRWVWLAAPFWGYLSFRLITWVHKNYLLMLYPLGYIALAKALNILLEWWRETATRLKAPRISMKLGSVLIGGIAVLLILLQIKWVSAQLPYVKDPKRWGTEDVATANFLLENGMIKNQEVCFKDYSVRLTFLLHCRRVQGGTKPEDWMGGWGALQMHCTSKGVDFLVLREQYLNSYPNFISLALEQPSTIPSWVHLVYENRNSPGRSIMVLKTDLSH